jgi:predicted GNAT family acetyltransferase
MDMVTDGIGPAARPEAEAQHRPGHAGAMSTITVTHRDDRSRFDLTVDGTPAGVLDYRRDGDAVEMFHTEVYPEFGGRGLGAALVRHALDEAHAQHWTVTPTCWFVRDYIAAHPSDAALLA